MKTADIHLAARLAMGWRFMRQSFVCVKGAASIEEGFEIAIRKMARHALN